MRNPNIFIVYSPDGEKIETSRANARDLTTHAGWSFEPPANIAACTVPPVKEEPKAEEPKEDTNAAPIEGSSEDTDEANEGEGEGSTDEGTGEEEEEARETYKVTAEAFAALTTREEVVALLADQFPDFKPHHKSGRDKLVEKLVELTNA